MTSSSASMPAASSAIRSDTVPLATAIPCRQPCASANRRSNSPTCGPSSLPHCPLRSVASRRSSSARSKTGHAGNGRVRSGGPPKRASKLDFSRRIVVRGPRSAIRKPSKPFRSIWVEYATTSWSPRLRPGSVDRFSRLPRTTDYGPRNAGYGRPSSNPR